MPASAVELRVRLRDGDSLLGTFLKLSSLETVDLAAAAGMDFVVVDLEHSQLGEAEARRLVRHAAAVGLPAVVRIGVVDAALVNRILEAGAAGIQLSSLRRREQADALLAAARYPPGGDRSISLAQPAAGYGGLDLAAYLAEEADGPLLVGQIESATTEGALADLLPGLDVTFVGSLDLSLSLGLPGRLADERVRERIEEIAAAGRAAGTVLGGWVGAPGALPAIRGSGARYLLVASDLQLLGTAMHELVAEVRSAPGG